MKLLAWLCIAWRPPVSSTLTHISFNDHPRCSPKSNAPNSASEGVISAAASTSSGLSLGPQHRGVREVRRRVVRPVGYGTEVLDQSGHEAASNAPRHAHERRGKSPMTSGVGMARRRFAWRS